MEGSSKGDGREMEGRWKTSHTSYASYASYASSI